MTDLKPACAPDKGRPLPRLDEQEQRGRERRHGDATTALRHEEQRAPAPVDDSSQADSAVYVGVVGCLFCASFG
jgi:hypothetical protein